MRIRRKEWEAMKKKIADLERKVQSLQPDSKTIAQKFQKILSEQTSEQSADNQEKL